MKATWIVKLVELNLHLELPMLLIRIKMDALLYLIVNYNLRPLNQIKFTGTLF